MVTAAPWFPLTIVEASTARTIVKPMRIRARESAAATLDGVVIRVSGMATIRRAGTAGGSVVLAFWATGRIDGTLIWRRGTRAVSI